MKHETLTFRFLDMSRGGFARLFLLLLLPCLSVIGVKAADNDGGDCLKTHSSQNVS